MGAHGNVSSVVTACAASTNAIGEGFHRIRDGYEDIVAVGGSEAAITPVAIAGFASMRALHEGKIKTVQVFHLMQNVKALSWRRRRCANP